MFVKFVDKDGNPTAFYRYSDGKVYMNFADDAVNPQGHSITYFHEYGHLIDHKAGNLPTQNSTFKDLLKSDFDATIKGYMQQKDFKTKREAYRDIKQDFVDMDTKKRADLSQISDLFGAMSGNQIGNCEIVYAHDKQYWSNMGKLGKEAFAHMTAARFVPEKCEWLEKFFPNALKEYDNIIKGASK